MIHSESGFLCPATSVALNIFDMITVNRNNNKQRAQVGRIEEMEYEGREGRKKGRKEERKKFS